MPTLFTFMQRAAAVQKDQGLYVHIAGLIGDVVDCQAHQVGQFTNQQWVRDLLSSLQQSTGEPAETADYAW